MDILYLLDQLEEALGAGSRLPLTSRTLVDEQEILDILDQIRVSIPDEIKVIADAHAEADRILRDADAQAADRLSDHALVRNAEMRAADIEDRALRQAEDVRREAEVMLPPRHDRA